VTAVRRGRVRDAALALPILLVFVAVVQAAPPSGTVEVPIARFCPSEMTLVGETCIDKWEAAIVEVRDDGTEIAWSPYHSPHGHKTRAHSRPNVTPQAYISMTEAKRACEGASKRLCKASEWKTACKGPNKTTWPYGPTHVELACVDTHRTAPLTKLYSGPAMFENRNMIDPRLNQMANTVAKTGEAQSCTNAWGAYDMVGNVNEWTDDGTLHGGFYLDTKTLKEGCDYTTAAHVPIYYDYSTGFRCCKDPSFEPEQKGEAKGKPPGKKLAKR
jgi:hypothetical protein